MRFASWQPLHRLVRELGAGTAALYVIDRLLRRCSQASSLTCYRFMVQPLREQPRLPPHRGQGFEFRLLDADAPALAGLARPPEVIARRFAEGAQCLMATKNQALAGCIWFTSDTYREDDVRVDYLLPPDRASVWDFDVYVAPSERLGFLFARQWDALDALLRPLGVRQTLSRISAFNQRSLASHRSLGARDCGWAVFLTLGASQCMLSTLPPYVAFGGRPRLQLRPDPDRQGRL